MPVAPISTSSFYSSINFIPISFHNDKATYENAPVTDEHFNGLGDLPSDIIDSRFAYLRKIVSQEEISYLFQDVTDIRIGTFDPSIHANNDYEFFMNRTNRKISCLNDQIRDLNENVLSMQNFSYIGFAVTLPLTVLAFAVKINALKVLSISFATFTVALFLTSCIQLYLIYRAESDLELLNLKKQNYHLLEALHFDNQQKQVIQKIFDSLFDYQAHVENKRVTFELDQLEHSRLAHDQSDIYLIDGKKTVLC
jgi:hypothetical protein